MGHSACRVSCRHGEIPAALTLGEPTRGEDHGVFFLVRESVPWKVAPTKLDDDSPDYLWLQVQVQVRVQVGGRPAD